MGRLVNLFGKPLLVLHVGVGVRELPSEGHAYTESTVMPFVCVKGLPEYDPDGDTTYVVSKEVVSALPDREDLVYPMTPINLGYGEVCVVDSQSFED